MITVAELRELANNKALSIGEAWNALDLAADRIEELEKLLDNIQENIRIRHCVTQTYPVRQDHTTVS